MSEDVKRAQEVVQALEEQEKQVRDLEELVEQVFNRFSLVLRVEPEKEALDEKTQVESSVPIVEMIRSKTRKINRSNSRLNNLMYLCEL